jgi:hypothetical protein
MPWLRSRFIITLFRGRRGWVAFGFLAIAVILGFGYVLATSEPPRQREARKVIFGICSLDSKIKVNCLCYSALVAARSSPDEQSEVIRLQALDNAAQSIANEVVRACPPPPPIGGGQLR